MNKNFSLSFSLCLFLFLSFFSSTPKYPFPLQSASPVKILDSIAVSDEKDNSNSPEEAPQTKCLVSLSKWDLGPIGVKAVADGDTLTLENKEKIRLIGINAPEKNEPLYEETTNALKAMVEKEKLYLTFDKEKKDRYQRTLAYIYVKRGDQFLFVNTRMVEMGMAIAFPFGKNHQYDSTFESLEKEAETAKRGIWKIQYNWKKNRERSTRHREDYYAKVAYEIAKKYKVALSSDQEVLVEKPEDLEKGIFRVTKIYDGDTVEFSDQKKIRLLGIDTPEKKAPFCDQARELLQMLILNKDVYLQYDQKEKDRYGRTLAHIFLKKEEEKYLFVNAQMVRSGLAYPYFIAPNVLHKKLFFKAQKQAIQDRLGFWSIVEHLKKEKEYIASKNHFHRPDCLDIRHINMEKAKRYKTREEAIAEGRTPGRCCNP